VGAVSRVAGAHRRRDHRGRRSSRGGAPGSPSPISLSSCEAGQ
jgi:hypothetical protein